MPKVIMLPGGSRREVDRGFQAASAGFRSVPAAALLEGGAAVAEPLPTGRRLVRSGSAEHPLLLLAPDNAVIDTIALLRAVGPITVIPRGGLLMYGPFAEDVHWSASPDGRFVVVLDAKAPAAATPGTYPMIAYNADGTVRWTREIEYTPRPVPEAVRDSVLDRALSLANVAPGTELTESIASALRRPRFHLPSYGVRISTTGDIWSRDSWKGEAIERWTVFDEDGRRAGRVQVAAGLHVLQVADRWVWAVRDTADGARLLQIPVRR